MKIALIIVGVILLIIFSGMLYVKYMLPDVPVTIVEVEITSERVQHGEYLANHVFVCMDCHSTRKWEEFSAPVKEGTLGKGGELFDEKSGFPGRYVSPNITPFGLKDWSDGEIYRAITSGIDKDGHALFPVMPYPNYGKMDTEDIYSIIAYLRSLPEIESSRPASVSNFPMNFILNTIPAKADPQTRPDKSDAVALGHYLALGSGCMECHTEVDKGTIIAGKELQGGRSFDMPGGYTLTTPNLTPDKQTGIGSWTKEQFIQKFRSFDPNQRAMAAVTGEEFNTIMPWTMYSKMKTEDLEAIYVYLTSLEPVNKPVNRWVKTVSN